LALKSQLIAFALLFGSVEMFGIPQMQIDWGKQQTRAGAKITKEQRNKQECQIYKKTNRLNVKISV